MLSMKIRSLISFGFLGLLAACGGDRDARPSPEAADPPPAQKSAADPEPPPDETVRVVFLGDSLTAGYELDESQAFPALVAERLEASGRRVKVVNAGVSGDTTAGGLARLDWLLRQQPDVLFVGLGANDGLRGVPLESSEANLRRILERARDAGVRVLLAGMLIPPNYGADYIEQFAAIYPRLAADLGVPLIPFLLEGVAAREDLNLADGIHPNAEGQRRVAETVLAYLKPLVDEVAAARDESLTRS